jgi:hypothetical protein
MKTKIEIAYSHIDEAKIKKSAQLLEKNDFTVILLKGKPDFENLIAIALTSSTKKSELLKENGWIKKESKRSDVTTLRVIPLIVFSSRDETLEKVWAKNVEKIVESLFSDEFKPFGLDLAGPKSQIEELNRLIEKYYSK